jgi:hypothetical protein
MVFPGLFIGLAFSRRSIGAFTIIIITAAAYKKPIINILPYLGAYNLLRA